MTIYFEKNNIYTKNLCLGITVYGERLTVIKGEEYRYWNPRRSKLAAWFLKYKNGLKIFDEIQQQSSNDLRPTTPRILYLGAATGTTVSHVSDFIVSGTIYAVEFAKVPMLKLLNLAQQRKNILPLFENALFPERYSPYVPMVDILYEDIAHRNQVLAFTLNAERFLKKNHYGLLMLKTRSISSIEKPEKVSRDVQNNLENLNYKVISNIPLTPFVKDHYAILVKKNA